MLDKLKHSAALEKFKTRFPTAHIAVVIIAIVMVWRGIWGFLDLYLFPETPALSHLFSLLLGIAVLYIDDFKIENLKR